MNFKNKCLILCFEVLFKLHSIRIVRFCWLFHNLSVFQFCFVDMKLERNRNSFFCIVCLLYPYKIYPQRPTMYFDAHLIRHRFCLRLVLPLMRVSCYVMQSKHLSVTRNFPVTNHAENQRPWGKKKSVIFTLSIFRQFIMSLFLPENYPINMKTV